MKKLPILLIGCLFLLAGCKKEKVYLFEVNDVTVTEAGSSKPNVKSDQEFISIAYTDLFGATITQAELEDLTLSYTSFGDKRLLIDMVIRNFLNDPAVDVPTDAEMRADVGQFVEDTFKKFLVRKPNEFEKWYLVDLINEDAAVSPELVYYGFMTSNEYRFY